jgi:hypothetical protein
VTQSLECSKIAEGWVARDSVMRAHNTPLCVPAVSITRKRQRVEGEHKGEKKKNIRKK